MAKRFLETNLWTQNRWFRKLTPENKLFWIYLITNCDSVGVWEIDIELASFIIDFKYPQNTIETFIDKLLIMPKGKIWIKDFCNFQYGLLKEENINNKPHQSYIKLLKKHSLWIDYTKTIQSLKEKDKDKDKEKEKNKEKEMIEKFETVWKLYPRKLGKEKSFDKFKKQVKTEDDYKNIIKAVKNYTESVQNAESNFIKHGSTFFNKDWKDYIDFKEVSNGKNQRNNAGNNQEFGGKTREGEKPEKLSNTSTEISIGGRNNKGV